MEDGAQSRFHQGVVTLRKRAQGGSQPANVAVSADEHARRLDEVFNHADDLAWQLTVYDAVHEGWRFANIGGRHALDTFGRRAALDSRSIALELCCGMGDTCRYLAQRFGCRVSGIDVNQKEIAAARRSLSNHGGHVIAQVSFNRIDLRCWEPDCEYDLVYVIDSLMYLPNRSEIFEKARRSLVPGATLAIAELTAGRELDDDMRHFMWASDGIVDVPALSTQLDMLRDGGFIAIEAEDMTALAIETCEKICAACVRHRGVLNATMSERRASWEQENNRYWQAFRDGTLCYAFIFASVPLYEVHTRSTGDAAPIVD